MDKLSPLPPPMTTYLPPSETNQPVKHPYRMLISNTGFRNKKAAKKIIYYLNASFCLLCTSQELSFSQRPKYSNVQKKRITPGSLRNPKQKRVGESCKTKVGMRCTMAVHVRYSPWYISQPSSAEQREMTTPGVVWRTWTTTANILNAHPKLTVCSIFNFEIFLTKRNKRNGLQSNVRIVSKKEIHFSINVVLGVAIVVS